MTRRRLESRQRPGLALGLVLFLAAPGAGLTAQDRPRGAAAGESREERQERRERRRSRRSRTRHSAALKVAGSTVEITYSLLPAGGPDHASIETLQEGDVLQLTRGMATKLETEVDLAFGDLVARTENVAAGYPGVYSLWLRRDTEGWSLILNHEPDIWGTMRDPEQDLGSVPVRHWLDEESTEELEVELLPVAGGGHLGIAWGRHRWGVEFTAAAATSGSQPQQGAAG